MSLCSVSREDTDKYNDKQIVENDNLCFYSDL